MKRLYSVCLSVSGYEEQEPGVTAFWSENDGETTTHGEFRLELEKPTGSEEFRAWLKEHLIALVEAL